MSTQRTHDGWDLRESGPANAPTILLLPGALCSGEFYEDVFAEPSLAAFHLVAATVPGFGRTKAPEDVSIENYARLTGKLAADLGAEVLVGHSYGANIAIEAAALATFTGPTVLLSASFSREDEFKILGVLDKLGRIPLLGRFIWANAPKGAASDVLKHGPENRRDVLAKDMKNNDGAYCKRSVREYFKYLDRYGNVADRLCKSGVKSWVVFGDNDEVKLQDDERAVLEACPTVKLSTVEGTHMFLIESPAQTAAVILEAVGAVAAK